MRGLWSLLVGAVLVGAVLLLGPQQEARATSVAPHDYVGAENCRACHQAAFDVWAAGPHRRAMERLSEVERRDARCRQCHTMVPADPAPSLEGVQCEVCHGPGRYYSVEHVMRDRELRSLLYLQTPTEKTCRQCHTDNTPRLEPFDFAAAMQKIRHWDDEPAAQAPSADPPSGK